MRSARKAIVGGLTAVVGSMLTALADGGLTGVEIGVAVLTGAGAALAVYQTTNDAPPTDASPATE